MKSIAIILLALLLTACSPMWEDGDYEVYEIDGYVSLGIKIDNSGSYLGRVDHRVVAVGSNKTYIVAKQREPGKVAALYFYIEREKDSKYLNANEITQGPFTEIEFAELTRELGLPGFSKEF